MRCTVGVSSSSNGEQKTNTAVGPVEGEQSYNADGTEKEAKFFIKKTVHKSSSGGVNNKTTVQGGVKRTTPSVKFVKP